jgi:Ca2+-binding RTX toxin-like protein
VALVASALVATTAPADAATVTRTFPIDPFGFSYGPGTVVFTGASGEANQVGIQLDAQGVTLTDAANAVTTSVCTQVDPRTVRCTGGGLSVALGDGDDTARVVDSRPANATAIRVDAGRGADTVIGGPVGEWFVDGGAGEADRFTGGGGEDVLSYAGRTTPVRVVLGTPGEDVLEAIPSLSGGSANDVLIGDGQANSLFGGLGNDRLEGGDGDDDLNGGAGDDRVLGDDGDDTLAGDAEISQAGRDVLEGGRGDDWLDLSAQDDEQISIAGPTYEPMDDLERDVARCGPGIDTTAFVERSDSTRQCEAVDIGSGTGLVTRLVRLSPSRLGLTIVRDSVEPRRVYVIPRRGRRTLLTRLVQVGEKRTTRLPLTAAGRRYLRRSGAVRVVIPSLGVSVNATVAR